MNISSIKKVAFGIALTATAFGAHAQKTITEGMINYSISVMGTTADAKSYFKGDTSSIDFQRGPAEIKMVAAKDDYFAVMVDVPVASIRKAAVSTPAELEEAASMMSQYTITKTAETKMIGTYNCIKYQAKDAKDGKVYELWVTKDITIPPTIFTRAFPGLDATPIQFTYIQGGDPKTAQVVTVKSVVDMKVPAGSFKIPADFDKISMTDLQAMGKRN